MIERASHISEIAQLEIDEHAAWLLEHVTDPAMLSFLRGVQRSVHLLVLMPHLGPKVDGCDDLREFGVRGCRGVRLVYRVSEELIEIVRVVHRNQYWIP